MNRQINRGLRNEISLLTGIISIGLYLAGKKRIASALGAASIAARIIPSFGRYSFLHKSVIITGGSRGLGLALAKELVREGARVSIFARDESELIRAKMFLESESDSDICAVPCDVNDTDQLKSAFDRVAFEFGKIDVLINNAGSVSAGPFEATNEKDFEAQMNLHFYANLRATRLVLPRFKSQGEGRIVNISSLGGKMSVPHMTPYCASKFALAGFSQGLSAELRKENIHVTTVYPGLMRTGSPIQAVFKGDQEKEFAWFAIGDSLPGLSISATRAAKQILRAVSENRSQVIISLPAKLGIFVHDNLPEVFLFAMSIVNRVLPTGLSQERKTGAASRHWLDGKLWAIPFRWIRENAQLRFNEAEKFDADYNLNIDSTLH